VKLSSDVALAVATILLAGRYLGAQQQGCPSPLRPDRVTEGAGSTIFGMPTPNSREAMLLPALEVAAFGFDPGSRRQ
jgi:hypothetical protein